MSSGNIVNVFLKENTGIAIPETIFGVNLELYQHAVTSLLNDRLLNAKFSGVPDEQTGIAREWRSMSANFAGIYYQLTPGEGIMGSNAQLIENTRGGPNVGLVQPGRWVQEGEELEISLWARCIHRPCRIEVGIRNSSVWGGPYTSVEIEINSACWQEYTCRIIAPVDDDAAVFFCFIQERGIVSIDQIHMRPAGQGYLNRELLDTLGSFQIPVIRFPGGCLTTCYHWQYGTGPVYKRPVMPDPVFKLSMNYDFGTDEYLDFCQEYSVIPHLSVNIGTNTPDEVEAWANYCREWYESRKIECPLVYWQLGNEHYGLWERSHMTAEMYIDVINELSPGIRRAYPNAKIVVLGQRSFDQFHEMTKGEWRRVVLEGCSHSIDMIVSQHYSTLPPQSDQQTQHNLVFQNAEWVKRELTNLAEDAGRHNIVAGMSEWNLWTKASHFDPQGFVEPLDMQHCLYAATLFHHFARLAPHFELANYYNLIAGMGMFTVERDQVHKSALAEIFFLYRTAFPAERVNCEYSSPKLVNDIDALDVLVLRNGHQCIVFAINKHINESIELKLPDEIAHGKCVTYATVSPLDMNTTITMTDIADKSIELLPLSISKITVEFEADYSGLINEDAPS